jgi:hypothetical protein
MKSPKGNDQYIYYSSMLTYILFKLYTKLYSSKLNHYLVRPLSTSNICAQFTGLYCATETTYH